MLDFKLIIVVFNSWICQNRFGFVLDLRMRDEYISKYNFNENSIKIRYSGFKIRFISILEDLNYYNF